MNDTKAKYRIISIPGDFGEFSVQQRGWLGWRTVDWTSHLLDAEAAVARLSAPARLFTASGEEITDAR